MDRKIVLIGSDPELFVGRDGVVDYAIGRVGGSKDAPIPVDFGALQEDNVLLEYNIDPAGSMDEFIHNMKAVLQTGRGVLAKHGLDVIMGLSSHVYDIEVLDRAGEAAWIFGCEPDMNGWSGEMNVFPTDVDPLLRTAGGHIHIGFGHIEEVTKVKSRNVIQMCDYLLGLPSTLMDTDERRKDLYGKAGACRLKSYGAEYRTLSNFWLGSDELMAWAYQNARASYERLGELPDMIKHISGDQVQNIINTNDKKAAEAACRVLGIAV